MRKIKDSLNPPDRLSSFFSVFSVANPLGRNVGWLLAARVGQQAILLLFTALVARQLGAVGLGQMAWVTAVLYLGNVISTWGLDTILQRDIGAARQTRAAPLAAALLLELLLAGGFILLLFLLPFGDQSPVAVAGLRLYGWSLLPLALLTLTSAALRGFEQMGWLAGLTLGTAVLQVAGTAVLFALGGGFVGLMGWLLAVQVVSAGAGWWLCRWVLPDFGLNWQTVRWSAIWQLLQTGFWLALLLGTAVLLQRLGVLLMSLLGSDWETGQLAAALRLVEAARLLPAAVMGALFPVLARGGLASGRLQVAGREEFSYQLGLLGYGVLAAVGLWLLAVPLVGLLFGGGYETAVSLLKILAWGVVPFTISLPLSVEMVVAGREKRVLLATLAVLVGTAVLTTVGFVQYCLLGLAVGLVVGEWLLAVALFAAVQNRF